MLGARGMLWKFNDKFNKKR